MKLTTKHYRTKVLLMILALIAFFIIILWFVQIVFLESYYEAAKERSVRQSANQIEEYLSNYNLETIDDIVEEIAYNGSLCVEFRDMDGKRVKLYELAGSNCIIHNNKALVVSQLMDMFRQVEGNELSRTLTSYRYDSKSYLIIRQVQDYYGTSYMLWVSAPLLPVGDTIDILKSQLKFLIFLLLIIGVAVSIYLARSLTKPILNISEAAKEVASGNANARAVVEGEDEIAQLAEDFNNMVDELGKVEKTRQAVFANISHDLRTPLTMIKGYAETIKDLTGDIPEKRDKQLDIIIKESDRLSYLVNDVLTFTTFNNNAYTLEKSVFDLNQMLLDITEQYNAISDGYTVVYQSQRPCRCLADPKRIEQVLYNLLNNAINHIGEDKIIVLEMQIVNFNCRVSVTDHGDGIPEEHLRNIWDRYYKVDKSHAKLSRGTGLGLSIVKSILEAHEVEYGVNSTLGQGAAFWFYLPLVNRDIKPE